MKRFFALMLSLILTLSLTACGEDTVASVIDDARDFIEDVDNVHCSTMSGMDLSSGEDSLSSVVAMEADLDFENKTSYVNMVSTKNNEDLSLEMYVDSSKTPPEYFVGSGDTWLRMDIDLGIEDDLGFSSDLSRDFEVYFAALETSDKTEMTVETLEGEDYYKLYSPITIKSIDMAKDFSIESFITGFLGEDTSNDTILSVLELLGDVDVTVYINCKTYAPYGFVLDLKPAIDTFYQNLEADDMTVTEAYSSAVYTDYDEAEVVIPENVLNAQSMTDVSNQMNKGE